MFAKAGHISGISRTIFKGERRWKRKIFEDKEIKGVFICDGALIKNKVW